MGFNLNKWAKYINTMGTLELQRGTPVLVPWDRFMMEFSCCFCKLIQKLGIYESIPREYAEEPRHHQDDMKQFLGSEILN